MKEIIKTIKNEEKGTAVIASGSGATTRATRSRGVNRLLSASGKAPTEKEKVLNTIPLIDKLHKNNKMDLTSLTDKELKELREKYNLTFDNDPSKLQLANFIASQLANNPHVDFKNFKFNNRIPSHTDGQYARGSYNTEAQGLELSGSDHPFPTFIHEGTHALDHLYTKTHQKEAMDWLAKHIPGRILDDTGVWYNGAQNILSGKSVDPSEVFSKQYPFERVKHELAEDTGENPSAYTYKDARDSITQESPQQFMQLSEFPGFLMENLGKKWKVNGSTPELGRKFLKKMAKGVRRGFYELDPIFGQGDKLETGTKLVEGNFIDRLVQIRNQAKYPGDVGAAAYRRYLELTAGLNPRELSEADGIRHRRTYDDLRDNSLTPEELYPVDPTDPMLVKRWKETNEELEDFRRELSFLSSSSSSSSSTPAGPGSLSRLSLPAGVAGTASSSPRSFSPPSSPPYSDLSRPVLTGAGSDGGGQDHFAYPASQGLARRKPSLAAALSPTYNTSFSSSSLPRSFAPSSNLTTGTRSVNISRTPIPPAFTRLPPPSLTLGPPSSVSPAPPSSFPSWPTPTWPSATSTPAAALATTYLAPGAPPPPTNPYTQGAGGAGGAVPRKKGGSVRLADLLQRRRSLSSYLTPFL